VTPVPAVIEAIREMARRAVRPETPARLRLWVAAGVLTAAALLASTSLLLARVQEQVRVIGDEAAPQAATAADLYFALSDMDAQVARLVLTAGSDELAGSQIDALGTYRQRSRQVDADLQRSLTTSTDATDRAIALELLDHLAMYRERVWQSLTAGDAAAGYYTQATNVLHLDLLPAAERLRQASEERLRQAYARKSVTEVWGVTLAVVLGALLVVLLLGLQVWLGYVEASYARFHNLPIARVGNAAGEFAELTDDSAGRTVAGAKITGTDGDLRLAIDYSTRTPGAYPLVLVTYEVVCRTGAPPLVKSFLTYASSPAGQAVATTLGYAPLPESLRAKVAAAVAAL
jgi:hypothetical protein